MPALDTWYTIPAGPGAAPAGPSMPRQSFRIRATGGRVLTDLSGIALDQSVPGIAELGTVPGWAAALLSEQTWWVNDSPTSMHQSVIALHRGRTLYWVGQIVKGLVSVTRPVSLHGGVEWTPAIPIEED